MKRLKRMIAVVVVMTFVLSLTTACYNQQTNNETNQVKPPQVEVQTEETVTVVDQIGREVVIKQPVNRIVSSYYISSSLLIALGVKDKVVGIEMKADTREIYKQAAKEFLDLPAVGSGKGINIEEIANLKPDLVIIPKKLKDSVEQLEALKIPVLVIDPETMDQFIACTELISKAVGQAKRGEELIQYYETKMNEVRELTKDLKQKPVVYLSAGSDYHSTCTSKMYQNDLIELAGGVNASKELTDGYWQTVSPEQILSWNPERWYMVSYAQYKKDDIMKDSKLSDVTAIKEEAVEMFPSRLEPWDYPTPSSVLGVLWLVNSLHPELYNQETYVKEAKEFYLNYYNIQVTEEDLGL